MPEVMRGEYQKFNGIFLKDQSSAAFPGKLLYRRHVAKATQEFNFGYTSQTSHPAG
jgi:hypothetical protein